MDKKILMRKTKRIALVAHDTRKGDMLDWARYNKKTLQKHDLWATGTTGYLLEQNIDLEINKLMSGPLGGDQQIGAMIANGEIDVVIFLWDPLEAHPHDVDVKALLRIAAVHNVIIACDRSTADFVLSSPLMNREYEKLVKDYTTYERRLENEQAVDGDIDPATYSNAPGSRVG